MLQDAHNIRTKEFYPCTSSEWNQRYPSVKGNCLANFSTPTKRCENCAWQVVLLQYTSHYFSHCNSDQWSRWSTFPVRITTTLHKETDSLRCWPSLLILKQNGEYVEQIIFIYEYFWCKMMDVVFTFRLENQDYLPSLPIKTKFLVASPHFLPASLQHIY